MRKIARLSDKERQELFQATSVKMGMRPEVVEKDFWVCFMLDYLFHDCEYKNAFVFKGGTSLSKSYHLIERFSEDIDLILDWRLIKDETNPWEERSKTKQDIYNKRINREAALFYREKLVPALYRDISQILEDESRVEVDADDEMVVNFVYPQTFETEYIIPHVRLEIGPLAEWMPSHITSVIPFAAEQYEWLFEQKSTDILTIDAERTFWEKITIMHKLAHFPEEKTLPHRYARHLYDVYCLGNSEYKQRAFDKKDLLEKDIAFKMKFYYAMNANYETATLKTIKLVPAACVLQPLRNDYSAMANMFYGTAPSFEEILAYLESLEKEIHALDEH